MKIPSMYRNPHLYLKHTKAKGRGVFCRRDIRKGEKIEITPSILLNEKETDRALKTFLADYIFSIGGISKSKRKIVGIKSLKDASCVILGVITFCNHDEKPNAEIVWEEVDGTLYHTLIATRAIPKNTEICTDYGKGWFEDRRKSTRSN